MLQDALSWFLRTPGMFDHVIPWSLLDHAQVSFLMWIQNRYGLIDVWFYGKTAVLISLAYSCMYLLLVNHSTAIDCKCKFHVVMILWMRSMTIGNCWQWWMHTEWGECHWINWIIANYCYLFLLRFGNCVAWMCKLLSYRSWQRLIQWIF